MRQLAQFSEGHPFVNQQRNPSQRAACEGNDPEHNGHSRRGFLFDAKYFRHADETGDLRAPAYTRELQRRSHQSYCQYQHSAREIQIGMKKRVAERLCDPQIDQDRESPVQNRVAYGGPKVGKRPYGLQTLTNPRNCGCKTAAYPARSAPLVQTSVDGSSAVQSVIDQGRDETTQNGQQHPSAMPQAPI